MAHISPPFTFLKGITKELKELNSAEHLVELGIAGSVKTLANKRYDGSGPDFIRLKGTGVRYPKKSVLIGCGVQLCSANKGRRNGKVGTRSDFHV